MLEDSTGHYYEEEQINNQELSGEILEILLNTREQGQIVEQLIHNQIVVKDDMIGKLHKELEFYRQEAAERYVNQVMKSIIKVRKDMVRNVSGEAWNESTADELRKEYTYILDDLTDLLEQQNIDSYQSNPGTVFDPTIHQAKLEVTDDINMDKRVKESLGEGYTKDGKVLQPERVIVYQYK